MSLTFSMAPATGRGDHRLCRQGQTPPRHPRGAGRGGVIDQPVANVAELRGVLQERLPHALKQLEYTTLNTVVNGCMVLANEQAFTIRSGDEVTIQAMLGGR